jgi:hypothetical protein
LRYSASREGIRRAEQDGLDAEKALLNRFQIEGSYEDLAKARDTLSVQAQKQLNHFNANDIVDMLDNGQLDTTEAIHALKMMGETELAHTLSERQKDIDIGKPDMGYNY